jgi:peptide/nickel transport system permease protein
MADVAMTRRSTLSPALALVLGLIGVLLALALFGPLLTPYDPVSTNPPVAMQAPSVAHWFGTDQLGRDIFSRTLAAAQVDLVMATSAVVLSLIIGSLLGALAGWYGAWIDGVVTRVLDTIMAFPLFVLAVGIAAALGNSVHSVVIATVVVNLPFYARQVRTEVNRRRTAGYVEAGQLAGLSTPRILVGHIMPNLVPALAVQSSLNMGWAILNAAGLSFIGLGIRPPQPEWGIMVADGAAYIYSGEWWTFVFPGGALMLAVLAFTLLGDTLRDLLDPRRA